MTNAFEFKREPQLAKAIVVIDGLTTRSSALLSGVITTYERTDLWIEGSDFQRIIDEVVVSGMSEGSATAFVETFIDMSLYHSLVGREVNSRSKEMSSPAFNYLEESFDRRRHAEAGDPVVKKSQQDNILMPIRFKHLNAGYDVLVQMLGDRLKAVFIAIDHPSELYRECYERAKQSIENPEVLYTEPDPRGYCERELHKRITAEVDDRMRVFFDSVFTLKEKYGDFVCCVDLFEFKSHPQGHKSEITNCLSREAGERFSRFHEDYLSTLDSSKHREFEENHSDLYAKFKVYMQKLNSVQKLDVQFR